MLERKVCFELENIISFAHSDAPALPTASAQSMTFG